jgi:FAD/FMN-containing dehydrogenase
VGLLKSAALREELGEGVRLLDRLKRELDPDGIMNPSKLWAAS